MMIGNFKLSWQNKQVYKPFNLKSLAIMMLALLLVNIANAQSDDLTFYELTEELNLLQEEEQPTFEEKIKRACNDIYGKNIFIFHEYISNTNKRKFEDSEIKELIIQANREADEFADDYDCRSEKKARVCFLEYRTAANLPILENIENQDYVIEVNIQVHCCLIEK